MGVEPLQLLKGCGTEAQVASSQFFLLQALVPVATLMPGTGSLLAKLAGPGSAPMIAFSRQLFPPSPRGFSVSQVRHSQSQVVDIHFGQFNFWGVTTSVPWFPFLQKEERV